MVENIDFKEVTRRNKETSKFRFWMNGETKDGAPELVIFEAGAETFFARTILAAMSRLTPDQLRSPVRVSSYIKDIEQGANAGDKTLAVNLSFGDGEHNRIDCRWKSSDDWQAISRQAIANVRAASGYVPREEREAGGNGYSQPQQQYQAPAPSPIAPPRPAAPARPVPAGQPPTRKDLLARINTDHLRMEDDMKRIVFSKALSATGKPVQTPIDTLTEEEFRRFVDEFLIAWGDSVTVEQGGLQMKLYGGDCSEAFMRVMALCADEDPWKKAKFWANAVGMAKSQAEPQQSIPDADTYDDIPF
jgi:hypothetical protein